MRNERDFPSAGAGQGVGARLPRKEDDRLMRGRGQFVADIRLAGLQDVHGRGHAPPRRRALQHH